MRHQPEYFLHYLPSWGGRVRGLELGGACVNNELNVEIRPEQPASVFRDGTYTVISITNIYLILLSGFKFWGRLLSMMTRLLSCLHSPRWDNPNFLFRNIAAWGMCERHDSNIMISAPCYLVICPHIGVNTAQPPGGRLSDDPGHQIGRHALPAVITVMLLTLSDVSVTSCIWREFR